MRGVNKVILVGTLGRDPETKTFGNGGSICNFSIATSESWTDKSTGERKELTEWHRISMNNRLGEVAQQYLKKGSKVYIEGNLRTRQWTDQNGQERYTTEIRGDSMQMLDSARQENKSGSAQSKSDSAGNYSPYESQMNQSRGQGGQSPNGYQYEKGYSQSQGATGDLDDDLPF